MFNYYLGLALLSLRHNAAITLLMVTAIGVGMGTSMTVYAMLRTMARDPIPEKSSRLYVPQIDNWGPGAGRPADDLQHSLTYRDAIALLKAHRGQRQTPLYAIGVAVIPPPGALRRFTVSGHAVGNEFFRMFDVPFKEGEPWSAADDAARANVVVLGAKLADKLFPGRNAVGQTVNLDDREYRVAGVLRHWDPVPRFYDIDMVTGMDEEDVFVPFATAIDRQMAYQSSSCYDPQGTQTSGWDGQLRSECIWIRFWVELPTAAAAADYRNFLYGYAAEQQRDGRFHWAPRVALQNLRQWLVLEKVVPNELRASSLLAFAFLLVCLVNSVSLMLAKFATRTAEFGVRRAVGASQRDIFLQCLTETALVGALGGMLGLGLTWLGLRMARGLLGGFGGGLSGYEAEDVAAQLTQLDATLVVTTLALAIIATVCSGLYPTWRASRTQPAWELKAQ